MSPPITLTSPLPAKDLLFAAMEVSSGLSRLDEMELELLSDRSDIDPAALLGKPLGVHVTLRDGAKRHFHGYVVRFGMARPQGRRHGWRASVRPWPWFMTRTTDCRIFQDMTVPEIVKAVFADHSAVADFEQKLVRSYRQWVYCVQYRETDFDFVARLLEHEGIYWYVRHDESRHTLVLVDDAGAHTATPACKSLDYY